MVVEESLPLDGKEHGLIDNWIRNIKDVYQKNISELKEIKDHKKLTDRLCELNVAQQVLNVGHTSIVQKVWNNNKELNIHGWIYSLDDGLLRDLGFGISSVEQLQNIFHIKD